MPEHEEPIKSDQVREQIWCDGVGGDPNGDGDGNGFWILYLVAWGGFWGIWDEVIKISHHTPLPVATPFIPIQLLLFLVYAVKVCYCTQN